MEFTIKQSVLKEELGFIQSVVERKSTIPVLSNILIESVGEKEIRIVGTDLDVTIRCDAEAGIKETGAMCVQAGRLFAIVPLLEGETIHFKKEENEWIRLVSGRFNSRIPGVSREQFPEIPQFKSTPMKLAAEIFNKFVQHTAFAITNEQSRFTLSGAKFFISDGTAKMITTDGHRLAYIEKKIGDAGEKANIDTLIPKKALMALVKIARDTDGEVSFGEDQNHIFFETEGRLLITRKLSGNFPNYEMVIPKDNDKKVIFDLEEMRNAIKRVSLLADERVRSVRLNIREGEIAINAQSAEEGEAHETVSAEYTGEEVQIGFNALYLQDFLNSISAAETGGKETEGETSASASEDETSQTKETEGNTVRVRETASRTRISFEFKDANAQTQLRIDGLKDYDYKYIVMPLRV